MENNLKLIENYRDDEILRNKHHDFISQIFPSISFKEWYNLGFWKENYIQHSFMKDDKIIASVSVMMMEVLISGEKQKAAQIGAVGTLPEFRNQGLSKKLLELILDKYSREVDFFYLFANESVLHFYPKFGFKPQSEYIFTQEKTVQKENCKLKKLNINEKEDFNLILPLLEKRKETTKLFGALNYSHITMWHILNVHPDNVYHHRDHDAIIIKSEKENKLNLFDIICKESFNIEAEIPSLIELDEINSVNYFFPNDVFDFNYTKTENAESGLFILGNPDFENLKIKYPETAVT